MKIKRLLAICMCISMIAAINIQSVYAASSDVTLTVEQDDKSTGNNTGTPSGGTPSSGTPSGDNGGGNNGGGGGDHYDNQVTPNKPGVKSGGIDGSGNQYYLRPGITVNTESQEYGYILGRLNWVYAPDSNLTRAEYATILYRVFNFENTKITKTFEDTKGNWAEEAINVLASNGVIQGVSSKEFNPNGTLKRDEALIMLSRILYTDKYSSTSSLATLKNHYAKTLLSKTLNSGIYTNLPENYDLTQTITREEMIHIINNIIYARNNDNSTVEKFIQQHQIYIDLTSKNTYYQDCLKALDKQYLNTKIGGLLA